MHLGPAIDRLVEAALAEDVGAGDLTSELTVPEEAPGRGRIVAKEKLVLAGARVASRAFELVDPRTALRWNARDGARVSAGQTVAEVSGLARSLLMAERVALNFLQRLSGIATQTAAFVDAVQGTGTRIVDTRKTTPGLRALEKYAVRVSGGHNHRFGLHDGILIKDNHLVSAGGVTSAVRAARDQAPHGLKVEVEVTTLAELEEALAAGADIVLLDNFAEEDWPAAVARAKGRALVEISGGIDLRRARVAASAGADLISVGALTHSVRAVDLSLEFESVAEAVATEGV
jgi:nicotinate-nucleotide pyrophosphorylase (carboxylating)